MSERSTKAVGSAPFEPEDYGYTATLLRDYCNTNPKAFQAVCSNNLNIILAALDAQANAWQPIDTAPEDGSDVLVWGTLNSMLVSDNSWHVAAYNRGWWSGGKTMSHLTHWMPLPEIPDAPADN